MLTPAVKNANSETYYAYVMPTMADRIRSLREARGMTQTALAQVVGVTRAAVSQWESGLVANIKLQTFLKLCEALHTDPQYLIFGNDRGRTKHRPSGHGSA
jgi:transcriptional regulator with XRE-family HTH domain